MKKGWTNNKITYVENAVFTDICTSHLLHGNRASVKLEICEGTEVSFFLKAAHVPANCKSLNNQVSDSDPT